MTQTLPRPSASLYVGSLPNDVAEATLFEVFNQVGPVASIRVCRDAITRRSLGYAYVNFHNVNDAERALDTLNYSLIKGKPCRIMWSQRDPSLRKSGLGNIFIKNLDKTIDNKSLHDTFSTFGNILSCRVMIDENGNSLGYGFVHFENAESAETATAKVNGMLLNGKKVYVGNHVSRKERQSKVEELKKSFTNVFVKNLDENVTDDQLRNLFTPHGQITSAVVMRDENGKSKGFGFINFATHEEAVNACDEMNEKEVGGKKLFVGRAQKKSERKDELHKKYEALRIERISKYQGVNLYVKNLDDSINDEKLRTEFSQYGTITSAKVQVDDKGNSKGFGFVCFSSPEEAQKAVTEMNGRMFASKPIYVAHAQRKEIRRQQLEAQYAQRTQLRMAQTGVLGANMYGQPIFYNAAMQPRAQQGFVYPPPMFPRNRWQNPQNQGQGQPEMMANGFNSNAVPQPGQNSSAGRPNNGVSRQPRQTRVPQQGQPQGQGQGQPSQGQLSQGQRPNNQTMQNMNQNRNRGFNSGGNPRYQQQPGGMRRDQQIQNNPSQNNDLLNLLSTAPPDQQKNIIGERLYVLIEEKEPQNAGKITGMLLEMEIAELLHLLDSTEALHMKIEEAVQVLQAHSTNEN